MQARVNLFAAAFFPHIIDDAFLDSVMAHVAESIKAKLLMTAALKSLVKQLEGRPCSGGKLITEIDDEVS